MKAFWVAHRGATITLAVLAAGITLLVALLATIDAGYGRSLLVRAVAARTGRAIEVKGTLQVRLFSHHPGIVAEGVIIGNPPWMPAGQTAEVGRITMDFVWPGSDQPSGIARLSMQGANFHLLRDAKGHANWQLIDPHKPRPHRNSWMIRSLSVPEAHVVLADAYRHRQFVGTVSAEGPSGTAQPVRIDGSGELNGRAVTFRLDADPLATASHEHPYHFTFSERSSGSRLVAQGFLPRPFDFTMVDASFESKGEDLKDLYFLTGVRLLDTGRYHLSGNASRRGKHTEYRELLATTGQSDVRGTVDIDSSNTRRKYDLNLNSQVIHMSDLGLRAAGRSTAPESALLLSDTAPSLRTLRDREATIRFHAQTVELGRLAAHNVSVRAMIDHGVLTVAPLSAEVLGGSAHARLKLDARKDIPTANLDLSMADLQLGKLPYKDPGAPPFEGPVQAQVVLSGTGRSLHQVAARANGTVSVQLPHGTMRESLAESAGGIDLHALGLLLAHSKQTVQVRCATATFKAVDGTLIAQDSFADTEPALITGEGRIDLGTEALDLTIQGHAKQLRLLRLRARVLLQGTLRHPSISLQKANSIPVIVDRGKARDADCAALLAGPRSAGAPPGSADRAVAATSR